MKHNLILRLLAGILIGIFSLHFVAAQATSVYYIAPAGSDSNPGTEAAPWRTLERVQTAFDNVPPGTHFYFQRGGTYAGTLDIDYRVQGEVGNPVVFAAYGNGPEPIINGLESLTGWTSTGANRWQTSCSNCGTRAKLLLLDGQEQPLARFPNLDEADEGYLYFDSATGRTSITDDALTTGINWTGAELVIRSIAWVLDRYPIVAHQGATLTLGAAVDETSYDFEVGYGYFLQNHPAALDRDGEWVYDPVSKLITLYLSSDPNVHQIQTTTVEKLVTLSNLEFVELRDLVLQGGAVAALDIVNCADVRLERVQVVNGAEQGVNVVNCHNFELVNSHVAQHLTHGVNLWSCDDCTIRQTVIEQIGTLAGMGKGGDGQYNAVEFAGNNSLFEQNIVRNIGYIAVSIRGVVTARYNHITSFARVKVDGGGIYCWHNKDSQIIGNIVMYAPGSSAGIPWNSTAVNGIYIDDDSENIDVRDNTIGYVGASGIVLHNTRDVRVVNNTVFASGENGLLIADDNLGQFESTASIIENNRFFTVGSDVPPLNVETALAGEEWVRRLGTLRSNHYCNPLRSTPIRLAYQPQWLTRELSVSAWQALYGHDAGSTECGITYPSHRELGPAGVNLLTNSGLAVNSDGWSGWPDTSLDLGWDARWGGSLRFGHIGNDPSALTYMNFGGIQASQTYRVRFRAQAEAVDTVLSLYLQRDEPDWRLFSDPVRLVVDGNDRVYTAYLTATQNDPNVRLTFELSRGGGVRRVWLDDIELVPVQAMPVTVNDIARIEVNPADTPSDVILDNQTYIDMDGQRYAPGSRVTVPPFSSIILIRDNSGVLLLTPTAVPTLIPTQPPTPVGPAVRVLTSSPAASIGSTVEVSLWLDQVTNVYGLDARCLVNPAVLVGTQLLESEYFNSSNSFYVNRGYQSDGQWNVAVSLLNPSLPLFGSGTAFGLSYQVVGTGFSPIVCDVTVVDSNGDVLPLTVINGEFRGQ